MSETRWTKEQLEAIESTGQNILVSAGAGSGKTAVLTARIVNKLKKGIKLKNLVVLTFTKASAFEMKERLRESLKKEIEEGNSDLKSELEFIDQANIQTFDSFSLFLVKKYYYLLGIERDVQIGDEALFSLIRKKIIDEVFEELYDNNKAFKNMIMRFCIKNDNYLKECIDNISKRIELLVNKEEVLQNYFCDFYQKEFVNEKQEELLKIIISKVSNIKLIMSFLMNSLSDKKLLDIVQSMDNSLTKLYNAKTYDDFLASKAVSFPDIPKSCSEEKEKEILKACKEKIKKIITKIQDICSYSSVEEMNRGIELIQEDVKVICDILMIISQRLWEYKKEKNVYAFMDIAKMAIDLMENNPQILNDYRASLNEILVDEYQDTSDIQEKLVTLISNNNVYAVGDIKQSIYRFRNANPSIFAKKYSDYQNHKGGKLISLDKNFRSRKEVINNVNMIFEQIMDLEVGGANYKDDHKLIYGSTNYDTFKKENNNLEIYEYFPNENSKYSHKEIEAIIIAKDILEKINNGYEVFDKDINGGKGGMRKVRFDDFAILTSDKKSFDIYLKVFEHYKIPLIAHTDTPFIASQEIVVIKNLLKCLYCFNNEEYYEENFKYSFTSVLRSFLIEASDKEIYAYFTKSTNTFDWVKEKLKNIADFSSEKSLGEILEMLYQEFSIYEKISLLNNLNDIENRLAFLLSKAYSLSKIGFGLYDFIDYLSRLADSKLDMEFHENLNFQKNICNILTIHKSKGLERNICYYPLLKNSFNFTETNDRILFDNSLGLIVPYFDDGIRNTFYKDILSEKYRLDNISERIRLFYVALTRAKDKIILVTPPLSNPSIKDNEGKILLADRVEYKSFHSILSSISSSLEPFIKTIEFMDPQDDYRKKNKRELNEKSNNNITIHDVSLVKEIQESKKASMSLNKLITKEEQEKLDFGTHIHSLFEHVDSLDDLNRIDLSVATSSVKAFLNHEVFKKKIINRYHEYEFIYHKDSEYYHGIIDLLLETSDTFIIIDYKLKNTDKEEYTEQINTYAKYLKAISDKKVEGYLYSVINREWKKVEIV